MWFCPRQKPDTDCVDPGDSTDIIHKRILKGTRPWCAAGSGSLGLALPKQALISGFPAGFRAPGPSFSWDDNDLQMKYSSVSICLDGLAVMRRFELQD